MPNAWLNFTLIPDRSFAKYIYIYIFFQRMWFWRVVISYGYSIPCVFINLLMIDNKLNILFLYNKLNLASKLIKIIIWLVQLLLSLFFGKKRGDIYSGWWEEYRGTHVNVTRWSVQPILMSMTWRYTISQCLIMSTASLRYYFSPP